MTNRYLEKIAVTKLVKEIANGGVTLTNSLKDVLVGKGVLRSGSRYLSGLSEGTEALSKKHGVPVTYINDFHEYTAHVKDHGGAAAVLHPDETGKSIPQIFIHEESLAHMSPFEKHVIVRHEINEARGAQKDLAKGRPLTQVRIQNDVEGNSGKSGVHNNLAILGRESTDVSNIPYMRLGNINSRDLLTHRTSSGETDTLKGITGKAYGTRYNGSDLAKLNASKGNLEKVDVDYLKGWVTPDKHAEVEKYLKDGIKGSI